MSLALMRATAASLASERQPINAARLRKRQLRRLARKRNLATGPRQNNPTGKSPQTLSSPPAKNIPLNTSGKSVI
jgi:hypothetical protein